MSARRVRLFHRLQIAAHRTQKSADREIAAAIDLTTAQAGVLSVLASAEGCSQKELADALGHNESAVTAMVKRLLRLGYVTRHRSARDARAWTLAISAEGQAALQATRKPFSKINQVIERTLTDKEIDDLADYLTRLSKAFGAAD